MSATDWFFYLIYKKGKKKESLVGAAFAESSRDARVTWYRNHGDTRRMPFLKIKSRRVLWKDIKAAKLLDTADELYSVAGKDHTICCVNNRKFRDILKAFERLL